MINNNNKVSIEGKSLIDFLSSSEVTKIVKHAPKQDDFDRWWKAYPATDTFTYQGKNFSGSRAMKVKKDDCREKLNKIISEGEYTIDDLVKSLEFEVLQKKKNSIKTNNNNLSYMQNSMTYLNQRTFEAFIELMKDGKEMKENDVPVGGTDI